MRRGDHEEVPPGSSEWSTTLSVKRGRTRWRKQRRGDEENAKHSTVKGEEETPEEATRRSRGASEGGDDSTGREKTERGTEI